MQIWAQQIVAKIPYYKLAKYQINPWAYYEVIEFSRKETPWGIPLNWSIRSIELRNITRFKQLTHFSALMYVNSVKIF